MEDNKCYVGERGKCNISLSGECDKARQLKRTMSWAADALLYGQEIDKENTVDKDIANVVECQKEQLARHNNQ